MLTDIERYKVSQWLDAIGYYRQEPFATADDAMVFVRTGWGTAMLFAKVEEFIRGGAVNVMSEPQRTAKLAEINLALCESYNYQSFRTMLTMAKEWWTVPFDGRRISEASIHERNGWTIHIITGLAPRWRSSLDIWAPDGMAIIPPRAPWEIMPEDLMSVLDAQRCVCTACRRPQSGPITRHGIFAARLCDACPDRHLDDAIDKGWLVPVSARIADIRSSVPLYDAEDRRQFQEQPPKHDGGDL